MLTGHLIQIENKADWLGGYTYKFVPIKEEMSYPYLNGYDTELEYVLETGTFVLTTDNQIKSYASEEEFSIDEESDTLLTLKYIGEYNLVKPYPSYMLDMPFSYVRERSGKLECILNLSEHDKDLYDELFEDNWDNIREHLYNIFEDFIYTYISGEGINKFSCVYDENEMAYVVTFGYNFFGYTGTNYYNALVSILAKEGLYSTWKNRSANDGELLVSFIYIKQ